MAADKDARPFYEERWFKGTAAVLGLVAVVFSLVGPPKLWDVIRDAFSDELPTDNTQYVLDASAAMGEPFGRVGTKLSAAADTLAQVAAPIESQGLALRSFGGACEERGDLLVDFGEGQAEEVREAAGEQNAAGESNLVNAVIAAIDDFSDDDRFPSDREFYKRIVVFTGSADACFGDDASEQIRRRITQTGIELDFTFVGVAVPKDERDRLRAVANDLEGPVVFADTDEELGLVVDYLELEPVIADSRAVVEIHNSVSQALDTFLDAVIDDQLDKAETALGDSEETFARTETPFDSIGARASREEVEVLHELLSRTRMIQEEQLVVGDVLLETRREPDTDGRETEYENALAEWEGLIRQQRATAAEIQRVLDDLGRRLPPLEN